MKKFKYMIRYLDNRLASKNSITDTNAAAVGGGIAGGAVLFLSLLALCCCWSRCHFRPKDAPVYFENITPTASEYHGGNLVPKGGINSL